MLFLLQPAFLRVVKGFHSQASIHISGKVGFHAVFRIHLSASPHLKMLCLPFNP